MDEPEIRAAIDRLEGETTVEGYSVGSLIGIKDVRAILAMMRSFDGRGNEVDKFHRPDAIGFGPVDPPVTLATWARMSRTGSAASSRATAPTCWSGEVHL